MNVDECATQEKKEIGGRFSRSGRYILINSQFHTTSTDDFREMGLWVFGELMLDFAVNISIRVED